MVGQGEYYYTYYPKIHDDINNHHNTFCLVGGGGGGGAPLWYNKIIIIPQNMITELLIRVSSHQLLFSMLGKVQVYAPMLGT